MWARGVVGSVVALVLGCGYGDNAPFHIVFSMPDATLVAAQDGDGPWVQLVPDDAGVLDFAVSSGRYGLAELCGDSQSGWASVWYSTEPFRETDPRPCYGTPFVQRRLSGTTAPGTQVFGDFPVVADALGAYQLWVESGIHDVIAVLPGSPTRMMIARGIDVTVDRTLDLPVATDGVVMNTMTPTVIGATGPVTVYADVNTAAGAYGYLSEDPMTVSVPPAAVLLDGDRPSIGATSMDLGCTAQKPLGSEPPRLKMPQRFSIELDRAEMRWESDPRIDWEYTNASVYDQSVSLHVSTTFAWLDATGAGNVVPILDVTTLPGWEPGMPRIRPGVEVWSGAWIARGEPAADYDICGESGLLTW